VDEEKTETIEKIKQHVVRNKTAYLAGGVCFVLGAATAIALKDKGSLVSVKEFLNMKWHSPTMTNIIMPSLGDPGNVVRDLDTGTIWASQGQSARSFGVDPWVVSNHLKGLLPDVKGHHLEVLGKAGQPIAA
jgi:hypothetical protein